MKKYCFGIDIGGTTVKCGFFNTEGDLLEKWEIPTRTEENGSRILPDIAQTINDKIAERGLDKGEIEGIGIDVPGPVHEDGHVDFAVNLHWGVVDIVGEMEKLTGIRTKALNDANAAALGECWKGGGAGYHNLIMVTLGTGIGGGIVINDKVIAGAHGAGGEIGHGHATEELTEPCNCGNVGCLEQVASATGIVRLAKMRLEKDDKPSVLRGRNFSAKDIWDAVKAGDEVADEIAEKFGFYLGRELSIYTVVSDPQLIVIGGGMSKAGTVVLDYIQKYYRQYAFASLHLPRLAMTQASTGQPRWFCNDKKAADCETAPGQRGESQEKSGEVSRRRFQKGARRFCVHKFLRKVSL